MHELGLRCPQHAIEWVGEALDALGALSVSVEDADAQTEAEQALFGEPGMPPPADGWERSVVKALFADAAQADEAARLLAVQDDFVGCSVLGVTEVPEQDWVRLTQSQFAPVQIAPGFWVVPSWHQPPEGAERVIRLDPGLAFGTGTHPTTRMCLRWIAAHGTAGQRVLDYGCGSGILGIAAALHGAAEVDAVDIDPAAVSASADNAQANGVTLHCALPDAAQGTYGVVLANILASPLKVLAPLLCAHVAAGGHLVLAGILERQEADLREAYAPWLALHVADRDEGWILMTAHRPAQA